MRLYPDWKKYSKLVNELNKKSIGMRNSGEWETKSTRIIVFDFRNYLNDTLVKVINYLDEKLSGMRNSVNKRI